MKIVLALAAAITNFAAAQGFLRCPRGTVQIGDLNADIGGCGLEGCDARYQESYGSIGDCRAGCENNGDCLSFTWAPLDGDQNHIGKTVCTLYDSVTPNQIWGTEQIMCGLLSCPSGTSQVGSINADIGGCGLEGCEARYQDNYANIRSCRRGCQNTTDCVAFTWAPLNGDQNHAGKTVCTLYNSDTPTAVWAKKQIFCELDLECPRGTEQVGDINADIGGCGLEGCEARYQDSYPSLQSCKIGCRRDSSCKGFTWAPLDGDQNHPGKTVCTLYDSAVPTSTWAPEQIFCAMPLMAFTGFGVYEIAISKDTLMYALLVVNIALILLAVGLCVCRQARTTKYQPVKLGFTTDDDDEAGHLQ